MHSTRSTPRACVAVAGRNARSAARRFRETWAPPASHAPSQYVSETGLSALPRCGAQLETCSASCKLRTVGAAVAGLAGACDER